MDLSTLIVTITLGGLFFGFILWMAIYSRRNAPKEADPDTSQSN